MGSWNAYDRPHISTYLGAPFLEGSVSRSFWREWLHVLAYTHLSLIVPCYSASPSRCVGFVGHESFPFRKGLSIPIQIHCFCFEFGHVSIFIGLDLLESCVETTIWHNGMRNRVLSTVASNGEDVPWRLERERIIIYERTWVSSIQHENLIMYRFVINSSQTTSCRLNSGSLRLISASNQFLKLNSMLHSISGLYVGWMRDFVCVCVWRLNDDIVGCPPTLGWYHLFFIPFGSIYPEKSSHLGKTVMVSTWFRTILTY